MSNLKNLLFKAIDKSAEMSKQAIAMASDAIEKFDTSMIRQASSDVLERLRKANISKTDDYVVEIHYDEEKGEHLVCSVTDNVLTVQVFYNSDNETSSRETKITIPEQYDVTKISKRIDRKRKLIVISFPMTNKSDGNVGGQSIQFKRKEA